MATSILVPEPVALERSSAAMPEPSAAVPAPVARQPFDWNGIRPVYRTMHAEFWRLTRPFSLKIPDDVWRDLAVLIAAMDVADRELDRLADAGDRRVLGRRIGELLAGANRLRERCPASPELIRRLASLHKVLGRRGIQVQFVATMNEIVDWAERKRLAGSHAAWLNSAAREWQIAGRLPLLILGASSTPRFESFFLRLCRTMHIVDTALDARQDYRDGLLPFRPGLAFHALLFFRLLRELPSLLFLHPGPLCLIGYALRMLRAASQPEPADSGAARDPGSLTGRPLDAA